MVRAIIKTGFAPEPAKAFPMRPSRNFLATVLCTSLACFVSTSLFTGCDGRAEASQGIGDGSQPLVPVVNPGNQAFYKADGSFNAEAVKKAYFDMMSAYHYPIPAFLKGDQFWASDFVGGNFATLGMGGILWKNENDTYGNNDGYTGSFSGKPYGYLGHEIYLLPGQMLPEHRHVGGSEGHGPKMESWHIRYGSVDFFGQYKGAGNETLIADMPADQKPYGAGEAWFKSKYVAKRSAGDVYTLENPESWHFQRAGKNGAIVSEYATFHNHVEFSKPGMVFSNTKAK